MDIWALRRRNLKALIATKDTNATQLAKKSELSVNTINKFLSGESKTIRWDTLDKICKALDLPTPLILDSDNPFEEAKNDLYKLISGLSDREAKELLRSLDPGTSET